MSSRHHVAWFSRGDFVIARVISVLIGMVIAVTTLVVPLVRALTGAPMVGRISIDEAGAGILTKGATFVAPALVQVQVSDLPAAINAFLIIPGAVLTLAAISVIVALWRLCASARDGAACTRRNVGSLQASGLSVVLAGLLHWVITGVASGALTDFLLGDGSIFVSEISGTQLLLFAFGALLMLVAAVLERGIDVDDGEQPA